MRDPYHLSCRFATFLEAKGSDIFCAVMLVAGVSISEIVLERAIGAGCVRKVFVCSLNALLVQGAFQFAVTAK